eukprot:5882809-Pyramimonas_sp.AAC.1
MSEWGRLEAVRALIFIFAQHVRFVLELVPAGSPELRHHWAMRALRGVRMRKEWMVVAVLGSYPALRVHFHGPRVYART